MYKATLPTLDYQTKVILVYCWEIAIQRALPLALHHVMIFPQRNMVSFAAKLSQIIFEFSAVRFGFSKYYAGCIKFDI